MNWPFPPAKIGWKAWSRAFTNPRLWAGPVRRIIGFHRLPAGRLGRTFPGTCAVFQVIPAPPAAPYLIKIFPPQCRLDARTEAYCLRRFSRIKIPSPPLLASGQLRAGWPYLVLGLLPGKPVRELPRINRAVFRKVGKIVRRIHDNRPPAPGIAWESWASFYSRRRIELEKDPFLSRFAGVFLPLLENTRTALLHADITEDHILVAKGRISGLIDFGDARLGPREYEWPALWFGACGRNPALFSSFIRGYGRPLAPDWRSRAMSATLLHKFVSRDIAKLAGKTPKKVADMEPGDLLNRLWPEIPAMKKI